MTIPESAIEFVEQLVGATTMCLADDLEDLAEDMRAAEPRVTAQRVAAVIEGHARSAQVAILRKLADEDDAEIAHLTMREGNTVVGSQAARDIAVRISAVHKSKARFERKLAELEAQS